MFADDTALISHGRTPGEASGKLESDLFVLSKYFASLKLKLNANKTKVLNVDRNLRGKNRNEFKSVLLNGNTVETVTEFNYLGVILQNTLEFTKQISSNIRRANHKNYLLSKFRGYLDDKMALNLYKAMVLPHIEFCNALLLGCSEKTQNRGLKMTLKKDRLYGTDKLHQETDCRYGNRGPLWL